MSSVKKFSQGFSYALAGFTTGLAQFNLKFHLFMAFLVILFGSILGLSPTEWLIIILCIVAVISAELFNTAIEEICNLLKVKLKLDYDTTRDPRDLAAAAVLVVAIGAAIIGLIIFIPKIGLLFPTY